MRVLRFPVHGGRNLNVCFVILPQNTSYEDVIFGEAVGGGDHVADVMTYVRNIEDDGQHGIEFDPTATHVVFNMGMVYPAD